MNHTDTSHNNDAKDYKGPKRLLWKVIALAVVIIAGTGLYFFLHKYSGAAEMQKNHPVAGNIHGKQYQLPYQHSYLNKAESYYRRNIFDSACHEYKKALSRFSKEKNWNGYVKACYKTAGCMLGANKKDSALYYLSKGKNAAYLNLGKKDIGTVFIHYYQGSYFISCQQPEKALEEYLQAKTILESYHGKYHPSLPNILDQVGYIYLYHFENFNKAEKFYREAQTLREDGGQANPLELATNYYNLSTSCRLKGDFTKALSYNKAALELYESFEGDFTSHISNCYNKSGNIHFYLGNFAEAKADYLSAIENLKKDPAKNELSLINYTNNLGAASVEMKDEKEAKSLFMKALGLNHPVRDSAELIRSYFNLAVCAQVEKDIPAARRFIEKSFSLAKIMYPAEHPQIAMIYQQFGDLYATMGQTDSSLRYMQKSFCALLHDYGNDSNFYQNPSRDVLFNDLQLLNLLNAKGKLLERKYTESPGEVNALNAALECYNLSDEVIRMNRLSHEREASKLFLSSAYKSTYDDAIHCLYRMQQLNPERSLDEAYFNFMEKSKAMVLLENINELEASQQVGIPEALRQMQDSIKASIAEIEFALKKVQEKGSSADEGKIRSLNTERFLYERKLEKLKEELQNKYPGYYQIRYSHVLTLKEIQRKLSAQDRIIEYHWTDSAVYALSFTNNSCSIHKISDVKGLQENLSTYLGLLSEEHMSQETETIQQKFDAYVRVAAYLYDTLVKPLVYNPDGRGAEKTNLTFIPAGALSSIPFEALLKIKPEKKKADYRALAYLIRDYKISYAHSCHILFKNKDNSKLQTDARPLILSYSLPVKESAIRKKEVTNPALFLSNASKLEDLARETGGAYCLATKKNLQERSPEYGIIHLFVHAVADRKDPSFSRLLLKGEEQQEQALHSHEIYRMDFRDKLVVLNACETGVGRDYQGEGIFNMARGFTFAGCSGVIVSLWKINEGPTFEISRNFYHFLEDRFDPAHAARLAKLKYLDEHDHLEVHPAYWSGLIAFNNRHEWEVEEHVFKGPYLVILLAALVLSWTGWMIVNKKVKSRAKQKEEYTASE